MEFVIKLCFCLGVLGWLWSIIRIGKYSRGLKKFKKEYGRGLKKFEVKYKALGSGHLEPKAAQNLLLQEEKLKKKKEKLKESNDPLDRRRFSLISALDDENGACRLPSLHDLNELTLQEEFGRWSSSGLRIFVSVLLILGICGTLFRVENLREETIMKDLPLVLEPSMWAVGGTVLLIWLRGFYEYFFRKYLKDLNLFTMEMLSRLQPQNLTSEDLDKEIENFKGKMGEFKKEIEKQNDLNKELHKATENLKSKSGADIDAASERIQRMLDQMERNRSDFARDSEERQRVIAYWIEGGQRSDELKATISRIRETEEKTRDDLERYHQLATEVDKAAYNVCGGVENLRELAEVSSSLPSLVEDMRKFEGDLRQIDDRRKEIKKATDLFDKLSKYVDEAEKSLTVIKEQALARNVEVQERLGNYGKEYENYNSAWEEQKSVHSLQKKDIEAHFEVLEGLKSDLSAEINKRLKCVWGRSINSSGKH